MQKRSAIKFEHRGIRPKIVCRIASDGPVFYGNFAHEQQSYSFYGRSLTEAWKAFIGTVNNIYKAEEN